MRLFSHEYTFPHPWPTVTAASWQKYPNPEWTPHVTNVDYLSRDIDSHGRLVTERLLTCQQAIPTFFTRLFGVHDCPASIVYERSVVDPSTKEMVLETRNLSFSHLMVVEETCRYSPDPFNAHNSTSFSQECRIKSVHGWSWIAGHIEDFCLSRFQLNAQRGRRALEDAIKKGQDAVDGLESLYAKIWYDEKLK